MLETELQRIYAGILALMDENLIPSPRTGEPKAFYSEKVLKTVEVLQVQYIGKINDVSVVRQGQVPTIRTVQRTVEVPQVQFHDRVADVPVSMQRQAPQERPAEANTFLNDFDELIPRWLNVVKDVVDSEDLPLKVCRETLLQNKILRVVKKNHVTKYLEMLAEIAELNFVDDAETAELLMFNTSKPGDEQFSYEERVKRMKEGQNDIYCITGESIPAVSSRKKGHEVLYVADPVDEYAVQLPEEFEMELKPTMKEGLDLGDHDEKNKLEELKDSLELFKDEDTSPATDIMNHASAIADSTDQLTGTGERLTSVSAAQHRSIQSTRQQHNNYHSKQAMQQRERKRRVKERERREERMKEEEIRKGERRRKKGNLKSRRT